jgi:hypothetical protein
MDLRIPFTIVAVVATLSCSETGSVTGPTDGPTRMLVGTVAETAPTTSTRIATASITVMNGLWAGRITTSDANGAFALALPAGQVTLRVQAENYLERSVSVSLSQNRNVNVELDPVFRMVTLARKNETILLDQTCPGWYDFSPPRRGPNCAANYVFDVHHNGTLTAELTSNDDSLSLHMAVFLSVDGKPSGMALPSEPHWRECCASTLTAEVGAHSQYVLQVNALPWDWPPGRSVSFDLTVRHPN